MNNKVLYSKIVKDLLNKSSKEKIKKDSLYHKKGGYVSWGVGTADFYVVVNKYKKEFKKLDDRKVLDLAWLFYRSGVEDQIYVGNFITALHSGTLPPSSIAFFDKSLDHFHTWGTIDDFCVHVMKTFLEKFPKQTFVFLKEWNKSPNMWKRRASVVVFTRGAGESGKFTEVALKLCNNLVNDDEDLVRKGVGWALKDIMRGDKPKVLAFIKRLRKRKVSAVITLYALRDIQGLEREKILNIK